MAVPRKDTTCGKRTDKGSFLFHFQRGNPESEKVHQMTLTGTLAFLLFFRGLTMHLRPHSLQMEKCLLFQQEVVSGRGPLSTICLPFCGPRLGFLLDHEDLR
jgi:hypothetical protein